MSEGLEGWLKKKTRAHWDNRNEMSIIFENSNEK